LNSNNRLDFIFLSNLFDLLRFLEGLNYLSLIQINPLENNLRCQGGSGAREVWATFGRPNQTGLAIPGLVAHQPKQGRRPTVATDGTGQDLASQKHETVGGNGQGGCRRQVEAI
jgi:hypothetical protein